MVAILLFINQELQENLNKQVFVNLDLLDNHLFSLFSDT